ncbi:threonylcarbamoyl-AMP synthase [Companilactobacillus sp. RD055328]|uniref:L-threonylcarbamoyladenylate synthase n=1 Tax=Companilactobacillus sp. RD055328 TaxID=2916634 RepID=UPI001FC82476|nr:L-threonylcarbamoyladenylate synthase [Companilactobacillus sp. RD055328]GKQ42889.1 threonylcarbamoyl-AMP synthase [Companilactobacillus sp. RD055328]
MDSKLISKDDLNQAAEFLEQGELVAFPTETVYGLGADATNEEAVKKVYLAKGRPSDNPLISHVSNQEMVWLYADESYKEQATKLMDAFWPGPLTIILPIKPNALSKSVTGGLTTAAFRMPDNEVTLELISKFKKPLVGPSANTSGKPSPTMPMHVLHDLDGKIAGVIDDGPCKIGVESTVIDLSVTVPTILRPGFITYDDLTNALGEVQSDQHHVKKEEIPKAPGMKYKHYAPTAQVIIIDNKNDFKEAYQEYSQKGVVGLLATDDILDTFNIEEKNTFSLGKNLQTSLQELFSGLRYFDNIEAVKFILAQGYSGDGISGAYMNRLNKSAGQIHYTKGEK